MAPEVGCAFCRTLGSEARADVDHRASLEIAYALQVVDHHKELDDSVVDLLRDKFTDDEIVELTVWIYCVTGGQMFGAILQPEETSPRAQAMFRAGLAAVARAQDSAS